MLKIYKISLIVLLMLIGYGCGDDENYGKWNEGVYVNSTKLHNICAPANDGSIRKNTSPGSILNEKLWVRSWNNETYLWFNEVPDNNPDNFSTIENYFASLKTPKITSRGKPKDQFHFIVDTESYRKRTEAGVELNYGIKWKYFWQNEKLKVFVADVQKNSPASKQGIERGYLLTKVNEIDLTQEITNNQQLQQVQLALNPTEQNQTNYFIFKTPTTDKKSIALTAKNISIIPIKNIKLIEQDGRRFGYLQFDSHIVIAQQPLINAIEKFKNNIDDLIIDLRYNGGGLLALSSQLAYMIAGAEKINNKYFEQEIHNSKIGKENPMSFYANKINYSTSRFYDTELPSLALPRVFVLTTANTCSASESLINGLRGIDVQVIQIGSKTCGKPYGFKPEDNCGNTFFTIQFKGINSKGYGDFIDGFTPDSHGDEGSKVPGCIVEDDLNNKLGDKKEKMLKTALYYATNGRCPMPNKIELRTLSQQLKINNNSLRSINNSFKTSDPLDNKIITTIKINDPLENKIIIPIKNKLQPIE